ncbi:MAG: glycoside hydrolase family 97 N-terminal domain-containing protein, partial [Duganella sp.]
MVKNLICAFAVGVIAAPGAMAVSPVSDPKLTTLSSPDGHITVQVIAKPGQPLVYTVARDGKPVLQPSALGLQLQGADLAGALTISGASKDKAIADDYRMAVGKKRDISYRANEKTWTVQNAQSQKMDIVFRVSNDGVAFRYVVAEPSLPRKQLIQERTTFVFPKSARAWLQPMSVAQTGWERTNPSYEEHYRMDIAVGTASPSAAGWVFPALFNNGENWVALSEAGMDGSYQASRLAAESNDGVYRIGNPMKAEAYGGKGLLAEVDGTLTTPWRLIALGSLATVTNSTLGTDLAAPAIPFDDKLVKPGHASWSWALLK